MLKRMSVLPRPPQAAAPGQCSHCGQPLSALLRQQQATHCRAAPCLARADLARTARQQARLGAQALAAATAQRPAGRVAPARVVFLQAWESVQVALTEAQRDSHFVYLQAVVAEGTVIDDSRLAAFTAVQGLPQADRLCAHCRGNCCQHGLGWHAFIDQRSLQRWADMQGGATLADAVAHFIAQLPATHAQGGCLYQGSRGCVLPREQRADICNGFACRPLQDVQRAVQQDPQAAVVALSVHAGQAQRVALITAHDTQALALPLPSPVPPG